ncbi:MAG TPA: histidine kinase [Candidatus Limnocylindrales bacterium]
MTTRLGSLATGIARGGWSSSLNPARVGRLLSVATVTLVALIFLGWGDPELELNALWVTIAIGAFIFGLRQTVLRIFVFTVIVAGFSAVTAGTTGFEFFELTEWPLMILISLIVAFLADRVTTTAARYATLYREASDRLVTAHEEERGRLARDLHDSVGQTLTATILTLDAADAALASSGADPSAGTDAARVDLRRARTLAASALDDVRDVAEQLRPRRITEMGLGAALLDLAESAGIPVEVRFDPRVLPPGLLESGHEIDAYRVVQEALGNAARHSHAAHAWLDAEVVDGTIAIQIGDDGIGFDQVATPPGLGLAGMQERAAILRGHLVVHATPGGGTVVDLRIPTSGPVEPDGRVGTPVRASGTPS